MLNVWVIPVEVFNMEVIERYMHERFSQVPFIKSVNPYLQFAAAAVPTTISYVLVWDIPDVGDTMNIGSVLWSFSQLYNLYSHDEMSQIIEPPMNLSKLEH